MTLNDLKRRNSPFCVFSPILISLLAKYVAVVEYRPILSVNIVEEFLSDSVVSVFASWAHVYSNEFGHIWNVHFSYRAISQFFEVE